MSSQRGAGGMCCSALPAPWAGPCRRLDRALCPAQEPLLSKQGRDCAFLPSQGERGAWGSREVHGVGGSSTDGAALRVFLGEREGDK